MDFHVLFDFLVSGSNGTTFYYDDIFSLNVILKEMILKGFQVCNLNPYMKKGYKYCSKRGEGLGEGMGYGGHGDGSGTFIGCGNSYGEGWGHGEGSGSTEESVDSNEFIWEEDLSLPSPIFGPYGIAT